MGTPRNLLASESNRMQVLYHGLVRKLLQGDLDAKALPGQIFYFLGAFLGTLGSQV